MSDTAPPGPRRALVAGGVSGLLAGAAAVAVSEAVAALLTGVTSPVFAVGNRAVDATPRPLKELAIETFGSRDKAILIAGVLLTIALLAALIGAVGVRRPRWALAAFLVLGLVATAAALTDRAATSGPALRLVPAAALLVTGTAALHVLLRTLRTPSPSGRAGDVRAGGAPTGTEGSAAPASPEVTSLATQPARVAGDDVPAAFDRRGFLRTAVAVGAVAGAAGAVRQTFGGSSAAAQ